MQIHRKVGTRILLRDLILFHVKLVLDGIKGFCMFWVSLAAAVADLILLRKEDRGRYFYAVLRMGERFDLWLNIYGPARLAGDNADGLFGESRAGDDSYMGRMEELLRPHADSGASSR